MAERGEQSRSRSLLRRSKRERTPARATDWLDALQRTDTLVMNALGVDSARLTFNHHGLEETPLGVTGGAPVLEALG